MLTVNVPSSDAATSIIDTAGVTSTEVTTAKTGSFTSTAAKPIIGTIAPPTVKAGAYLHRPGPHGHRRPDHRPDSSFSLSSPPSWAAIDSTTGAITLTPGITVSGSFTLSVTARPIPPPM